MKIADVSTTELRDADVDVALLPTGSTEGHGPHAPLGTDALIAESIALEAADSEAGAAVLPTLAVGVSEEHRAFDGTLYLSPDTFRDVVSETLESASRWFDVAVVVNGHGGNVPALREVCARLTRDDVLFATEWTWWRALERDDMGHAGRLESSLVDYLVGLRSEPVDGVDSWGRHVESSQVAYDSDEFTESGVVGPASEASSEEGEELFDDAVESLSRLVEEVR
ncbi:MAG: creatininase family protein [Halobacteriota archaeon]